MSIKFPLSFTVLFLSFLCFLGCSKTENETTETITPPAPVPEANAVLNYEINAENALDFGDVVENISKSISITFTNTGNADLTISNISLPEAFDTEFNTTTLKPNDSTIVSINFNPIAIKEYNGFLEIDSDATNTVTNIAIAGKGVSNIYEGSISLLNQEEVDEFSLSGYIKITGVLFIGNLTGNSSAISSLENLNVLTEIGSLDIANTTELTNLDGLEGIVINQSISIGRNSKLENLNALSHITIVENFVNIFGNPMLNDISGLSNIIEIKNDLWIRENNILTSLNAFSKLTTIGDSFRLVDNIAIESLDGLENLTQQGGSFTVMNNSKLYNYCAIRSLLNSENFTGSFSHTRWNRYNPEIGNVRSGECSREIPLDTYHGSLNLESDNDIQRLVAKNFTKFEGRLNITGYRELGEITTLEPMQNFTSITDLNINNTDLVNLNGLKNLTGLNTLTIKFNESLTDYCAISTLAQNEETRNYTVENNLFNPTLNDLMEENCAQ